MKNDGVTPQRPVASAAADASRTRRMTAVEDSIVASVAVAAEYKVWLVLKNL